jgi:phosphoribosylpyrophosphate synthetase
MDAMHVISSSDIDRFFVTDTITKDLPKKFSVITIAPLLSKVILHMHEGKPLTPIFNEFTGI